VRALVLDASEMKSGNMRGGNGWMQSVQKILLDNSTILKVNHTVRIALQIWVVGDLLAEVHTSKRTKCDAMNYPYCRIRESDNHAHDGNSSI
jgi:hypothetical protein